MRPAIQLHAHPALGRRPEGIKKYFQGLGAIFASVLTVLSIPAWAAAPSPLLCVDVRQPFLSGITDAEVVAAIRARVPRGRIRVSTCVPSGGATWSVSVAAPSARTVDIVAVGAALDEKQTITLDGNDARDIVRQIALAAAELTRPSLMGWLESNDEAVEPPPPEPPVPPVPVVQSEPEQVVLTPRDSKPRLWLALRTGTRLRSGSPATLHLELAPELRFRHWRMLATIGGDFLGSRSSASVTTRLTELDLGLTAGRDFFSDRLFLGLGGQARHTWSAITAPVATKAPKAWSVGVHAMATVAVWRGDGFEIGLAGRLSWWREPLRLFYDGAEVRKQAHVDGVAAAYIAIALD